MHGRAWSESESSCVREMKAQGKSWKEIASFVGRDSRAVRAHIKRLDRTPEEIAEHKRTLQIRREYNAFIAAHPAGEIDPAILYRLLAERNQRWDAEQHASIAGILFGDPPPGYSALDRINRSIDDAMQDQINRCNIPNQRIWRPRLSEIA